MRCSYAAQRGQKRGGGRLRGLHTLRGLHNNLDASFVKVLYRKKKRTGDGEKMCREGPRDTTFSTLSAPMKLTKREIG